MLLTAALGTLGLWSATGCAPGPAARAPIEITINGAAFAVGDVTAHVGDTVTWTNKDVVDHTATARNGDWRVVIEAGKAASVVMKKAGVVDYYCEYHPNMTGRVTVTPAG
jgi:plastocyanin